ncbi:phospholipase, partial [Pseudomonas sp. NPDC089396]
TTHGSANINTRSMQVDSELNIAHEWASETQKLRRRLWDLHTGGEGVKNNPEQAFIAWQKIIDDNRRKQRSGLAPSCSLVEFFYGAAVLKDLD